jgi:hypothetical protein
MRGVSNPFLALPTNRAAMHPSMRQRIQHYLDRRERPYLG